MREGERQRVNVENCVRICMCACDLILFVCEYCIQCRVIKCLRNGFEILCAYMVGLCLDLHHCIALPSVHASRKHKFNPDIYIYSRLEWNAHCLLLRIVVKNTLKIIKNAIFWQIAQLDFRKISWVSSLFCHVNV